MVAGSMDQFILWFNMLTFTLMVASAGLVYLVYLRSPHAWLRSFIIYTGTHAFWLLFGTYVFFQAVFLPAPIDSLTLIFAYVRVAVSFVVLLSGSLFFLILADDRVGRIGTVVMVASASVVGLLIGLSLGFDLVWAGTAASTVFYAYFAGLSIYALVKVLKETGARRRMLFFVVYSVASHSVIAVLTVFFVFVPPDPSRGMLVSALSTGLFCAIWGLLMVITASRWVSMGLISSQEELPPAFIEDYKISRREVEIVEVIREGLTSRQIGERLFISQRTVEAHIHNIYRKCDVINRVELINKISRYS